MTGRFAPISPARVDFSDPAAPRSLDYDDVFHARAGARAQAEQVFLRGNGLPARWAGRARFVILETGFGLGHNFLTTWAAWRDDPLRGDRLWFVSIEKHPVDRQTLLRVHADSPWPELVREWLEAWPPATPDLHAIDLDGGRVMLRLAFGDIAEWLPRLMLQADAIYLDGFAPARNPAMWAPQTLQRLRHLAAPGATAATWSVARPVRDGLRAAGFDVERAEGFDAKRERLVARFAPRYALKVPPGLAFGAVGGEVAIVGAGLAGAALAEALTRHGCAATVYEQADGPAAGASGNVAGLLHGVVHGHDGPYARWHRAAFLRARAAVAPRVAAGQVRGRLDGLLRLVPDALAVDAHGPPPRLPPEYVVWLDAASAGTRAGCRLSSPGWWYPQGGWVDPRSIVSDLLCRGGVPVRYATRIDRLLQDASGRWRLLNDAGREVAVADQVVLAAAQGAVRLAAMPLGPWQTLRGQLTRIPAALHSSHLRVPIAGNGYALPLPNGDLLLGATRDANDTEAGLRDADHRRNLAPWHALFSDSSLTLATLDGRVGWRVETADRLPWIGALPLPGAARTPRDDQPRFVPRQAGLHILAGLGSRGIAQSALGAEVVASWISGAPMPIGRDLLDAVDAARFVARAARVRTAAS